MIIPLGMIRATKQDGYGRTVNCLINPLQVMRIMGFCDCTIVYLGDGSHVQVRESAETLEKAWCNIMKNAVEEPALEELS